ncbi:MAG TPA: hypothetical protein VHL59_13650 [Thermoanaerobaculia bacterium]|nr:hypothetical protein [Thermoanaerobaculia bacterium]
MIRFGVLKAEDYRPPYRDRLRRVLLGRRISLQLLRTADVPTPAEIAIFETAMQQTRLTCGIYRTTFRNRFRDIDPVVNAIAAERFGRDSAVDVHDWAASDALTSVEWAQSLFAGFPRATLTASDLMLFLVEVTLPDGTAFVLEPDGGALQYVRKPFVIQLTPPEPKALVVNHWLGRRATAKLAEVRKSLTIPQEWLESNDETARVASFVLRKIPMTHPEARALAARDPRFSIRRHSVFAPLGRLVHIVRTMNIYQFSYFPEARLAEGVCAVRESLEPGGLWIVGRTIDSAREHRASVLEKQPDGFRVVQRFGGGWEVEELALR